MKDRRVEKPDGAATTRRSFLERVSTGWVVFSAACVAGIAATGRFFFPVDRLDRPSRFKVGAPASYRASPQGEIDGRWKEKHGIWIVRDLEGIYALSATCTHLGCTVNWLETERKFKCPCHGSGFYPSGKHFEGPAPRPLERFKITLAQDGQIEIDKDRAYLWERGEWDDPDSFLPLRYVT